MGELKGWPSNPRTIGEADAGRLTSSLIEFGQIQTIAIDPDNVIIDGHQRSKVWKAYSDFGDDYIVDVRVSNRTLTEEERQKLSILLHEGATGDWDFTALEQWDIEEEELEGWGFDMELFEDDEENPWFDDEIPEEDPEAEAKVDEADVLQEKWQVELGQMYQMGNHRIICGDCTDPDVVERLMGDKQAVLLCTDPPYNVQYEISKNPRHKIREITNDWLSDDDWAQFVASWGQVCQKYVTGDCYIWGQSGAGGMRMRLWLIEMGLHWSATIIWKKQQLVLTPANYQRMYEMCLYGWFGERSSFTADRKQTEVWEVDRPRNSKLHPTMKPLELFEISIKNSSKKGDAVLDIFLGSGTTLIACERMERVCYGIEVEPKYISVSLQRWVDTFGTQPELIK